MSTTDDRMETIHDRAAIRDKMIERHHERQKLTDVEGKAEA